MRLSNLFDIKAYEDRYKEYKRYLTSGKPGVEERACN